MIFRSKIYKNLVCQLALKMIKIVSHKKSATKIEKNSDIIIAMEGTKHLLERNTQDYELT